MFRVLKATKDAYITNKVISNRIRGEDANTGRAGTLDLFKLHEESTLPGSGSGVQELSRILIKFDLDPLRELTGSILNLSDSSFECKLKLSDVIGGQTVPSNFRIVSYPLSRSFDEGVGRDIVSFSDLDACNFITASISSGTPVAWGSSGANLSGVLGDSTLDIISSGDLLDGSGVVDLGRTQLFDNGTEDLSIDVTPIVSATLAGNLPDHGYRISFSGSFETSDRTLFVKRFASRHSTNTRIRPRLEVKFDDSIRDNSGDFFFDLTGSIFLNNFHRGTPSNILSGPSLTPVTGANSLLIKLFTGSFEKSATASQLSFGQNFSDGIYFADLAISSLDSTVVSGTVTLASHIQTSGSVTFNKVWSSIDETITYLSSTQIVKVIDRTLSTGLPRQAFVTVINAAESYKLSDKVRFRVNVFDHYVDPVLTRVPVVRKSEIIDKMYYQVRDTNSGDIVIPFDTDTEKNATHLSVDSEGLYFDFFMNDLDLGRVYSLEFLIRERSTDQTFSDNGVRFRIDP